MFLNSIYFKNYDIITKDLFFIIKLSKRENINPLSILIENEYMSSIDTLYNEIYDKYEDTILDNSTPLAPLRLLKKFMEVDNNVIKCTVLCKNLKQEQFIKNLIPDINTIIETDYSNIAIDKYDSFFIEDYSRTLQFKDLKGKNIIILNYPFNLEKGINKLVPRMDISVFITDLNQIFLVDPYFELEQPLDIKINIEKLKEDLK